MKSAHADAAAGKPSVPVGTPHPDRLVPPLFDVDGVSVVFVRPHIPSWKYGAKHYFGRCPSMLWIDLFWLLACMEFLFLVAVLDCCWFDRESVVFMSQKLINSVVHQSLVVSFVDIFSVKCCGSI